MYMDWRVNLTHLFLAAFLLFGVYTVFEYKDDSVTVTGEARSEQKTQVATFNAGVMVVSDNKESAISEVNTKMEAIITSVKNFGIDEKDIKTQNMSIYQQEQPRSGEWRVSNDISIKLRDVDKATDLTSLLTQSGATSVYGPSFTVDDTGEAETGLVEQAIKNAREKAETMAAASGRKVGKVVKIAEGYSAPGLYPVAERSAMGGGGAPLEPGSQTVTKTVTVVFELN